MDGKHGNSGEEVNGSLSVTNCTFIDNDGVTVAMIFMYLKVHQQVRRVRLLLQILMLKIFLVLLVAKLLMISRIMMLFIQDIMQIHMLEIRQRQHQNLTV